MTRCSASCEAGKSVVVAVLIIVVPRCRFAVMPTDGATDIFQWLINDSLTLSDKESPHPALTPVHGMEYAMGPDAAEKFLTAPGFKPGSPA